MNVEQTIIHSILDHPLLYKDINYKYSREKVLNNLFFTNGNGYDWEDGELVYPDMKEYYEKKDLHRKFPEDYFNNKIMQTEEDELEWVKKFRLEQARQYKPHEIHSKKAETIYPICKYAKICELPDNIKPGWLSVAEEAVDMALEYWNNKYKHSRDTYIKKWVVEREYDKIHKYVLGQVDYLSEAKLRICEIRKSRGTV